MKIVGGDSGRCEHEAFVNAVLLAPSERAVVDVLFDQAGHVTLEHHTPDRCYPLAAITDAATQHRRTTVESAPPDRVADDRHGLGIVGKPVPKSGSDAEDIPVVGRHDFCGNEFALAVNIEIRLHGKRRGQSGECAVPRLEISINWIRECDDRAAGNSDQPLWIREGHRPNQDRVEPKIAVFTPIPSPRHSTARYANPGERPSCRTA
jgi:hypothetical protein